MTYTLIDSTLYQPYLPALVEKLTLLGDHRVTYKNEIHRTSRFAICHYKICVDNGAVVLSYDPDKSRVASTDKKTNSDPEILNCKSIELVLHQFLADINDRTLTRVEVKLIQTACFPFEFNPHRDSQFWRLRHIRYLATVLVSCGGIDGGNMQLFHSENDKIGPFQLIEELPAVAGAGYIVDETPQLIFHGMRTATKCDDGAHRAALLLRFF
jgi:hypothetical protein